MQSTLILADRASGGPAAASSTAAPAAGAAAAAAPAAGAAAAAAGAALASWQMLGYAHCPALQASRGTRLIAEASFAGYPIPCS